MATLNTKVKLYLEANSKVYNNELDNFQLRDDGYGAYIDITAGKLDNTGEWHKHIKAVKDANSKG